MSRANIARLASAALADLPADLQEVALARAGIEKVFAWDPETKRYSLPCPRVIVWSAAPIDLILRVWASARAVATIAEVTP